MGMMAEEINVNNIRTLTTNSRNLNVCGIGDTPYTIHNEAKCVERFYSHIGSDKDYFTTEGNNPIKFNRFHVCNKAIREIGKDAKWVEEIVVDSEVFKVDEIYLGTESGFNLTCDYDELCELDEKVMIIIKYHNS